MSKETETRLTFLQGGFYRNYWNLIMFLLITANMNIWVVITWLFNWASFLKNGGKQA